MLKSLKLQNVGPAPSMELELGERLNLLTGDNGLGKSFLLDVMWWALTRKWPQDVNEWMTSGYPARPRDPKQQASIECSLQGKSGSIVSPSSIFDRVNQYWPNKVGRPPSPGLVLYAHADGSFSIWDPARNYWKHGGDSDLPQKVPAYVLTPTEVWDELETEVDGKEIIVCSGLIADWKSWILEGGKAAKMMQAVLSKLAPPGETLEPGKLVKVFLQEDRQYPTLRTAHGVEVPVIHASSGVRRILALAYMLVWAWNAHVDATELQGEEPTNQVILLVDEAEAHLHPKWQRTILSSLLEVVNELRNDVKVQVVAATHSPLVMASAEPLFDPECDAWFDLDLEEGNVLLRKRPFVRRGDVSNWLTSEAFDLESALGKLDAEGAILEARKVLSQPSPTHAVIRKADESLRHAGLSDIDPFWARWSFFVEQKLGINGTHHSQGEKR